MLDPIVKSGLVRPGPFLGHKQTGLQLVFPPSMLATWGFMGVPAQCICGLSCRLVLDPNQEKVTLTGEARLPG